MTADRYHSTVLIGCYVFYAVDSTLLKLRAAANNYSAHRIAHRRLETDANASRWLSLNSAVFGNNPTHPPAPCSPRFAGRAGGDGRMGEGGRLRRPPSPIPLIPPPHAAERRGEGAGGGASGYRVSTDGT